MQFEWDEAKSARNRVLRRMSFDLAMEIFENPVLEQRDDRRDYGEVRIQVIGSAGGRIFACVYTDRGPVRRIISLRAANKGERDAYRAKVAI